MRRGVLAGVLLMVVTALAVPVAAEPRAAVPDANPGLIAYNRPSPDGTVEIRLIQSDGSGDRALTTEADVGPMWSPRGDALSFTRTGERGVPSIVSLADGSVRAIADDGAEPVVSPDGTRAAYVKASPEGPSAGLAVVELDSGARLDLPGTEGASLPVWSPTGEALGYTGESGDGVWRVAADASAPPDRLTPMALQITGAADWSPDGQLLAFTARLDPNAQQESLYVVRPDGGGLRALTTFDETYPSGPVWSPDGEQIAVSGRTPSSDGYDIFLVSFDGDLIAVGQIRSPGDEALPSWSADARELVVTRFRSAQSDDLTSDLVVLPVQGGAERQITNGAPSIRPQFAPGTTWRLGGLSRVTTAVTLSRATFASADTVLLARADDYADALAGAPLAGQTGAPVLLTGRDELDPQTAAEVQRLGAATVVLLGGEAALSAKVAEQADALEGVDSVQRVAGPTRFATAGEVAERVSAAAPETSTVYVVEGLDPDPDRGWPDAVSVGALAAHEERPVLLVTTEDLPDDTAEAIEAVGAQLAVVVGGPAAVSADVEAELRDLGLEVERVFGETRYASSVEVARRAAAAGLDPGRAVLATGANFPDALAAGPVAAAVGGPVLLVPGSDLASAPVVRDYLDGLSDVGRLRIAGGPGAIGVGVAVQVERATTPDG